MSSEHIYSGPDAVPLSAHDRMVIDATQKARARLERAEKSETAPAETACFGLVDREGKSCGFRRIYALPPGRHVPRKKLVDGVMVYGCGAHEALVGTVPLGGEERHKSNRPTVLAPLSVLRGLTVPIDSASDLALGDAILPAEAANKRSAPGHSASVDDRNRIQRPAGEASAAAIDPTSEPGNSAEPANAPELDDTEFDTNPLADREANSTDKTEVHAVENSRKIDAESMGNSRVVVPFTKPAQTAKPNPKLEAALALAKHGFPVFPLKPYVDPGPHATPQQREAAIKRAKSPLIEDWQNRATTDPEKIRKCWTEDPTRNIGISTENYLVVDIDPRNGGNETLAELAKTHHFPPTLISKTQGGGQHWIYLLPPGVRVRGGTHALGAGIDVKSWGGLIVAPGSEIEGRFYEWLKDLPVALAEQWLIDECGAPRSRAENAGKRLIPEDEEVVQRAREWMERQPAAEYGTIDDTRAWMARVCGDYGCGVDTIEELLTEWCMRWDIPTSPERLRVIADSSLRNRQNAIGVRSAIGFEAIEIAERPTGDAYAKTTNTGSEDIPEIPPKRVRKASPVKPFDEEALPPRPWILTHAAQRSNVTILAGNPGAYKSTYAFPLALAAITGRDDICGFRVKERTSVWMFNQEEPMDELQRRLRAAMKAHNVSWDDLNDENGEPMLYMDSGVVDGDGDDPPLMFATRQPNRTLKVNRDEINALVETIRERKVGLLIADPMSEFHEGEENNNTEMRIVTGAIRSVAVKSNCAALVFAHTAKPPMAATKNYAGHMGAIRGASSQAGAARIVGTVFRGAEADKSKWILPGGPEGYIRVDICKINGGPEQTIWLKHELQPVGSERVKAVRHVKIEPKVKEADILVEAFARVMAETGQINNVPLKTLIDQVPELTAEDKDALGGHAQARKRRLNDAFGGDDAIEVLTDYGKLIRDAGKPPIGTTLTLKLLKKQATESDDSVPEDSLD